jgi:hypothetical protein
MGCATAPIVVQPCPKMPELVVQPQEANFQDRMQNFLQGNLPEQIAQ